ARRLGEKLLLDVEVEGLSADSDATNNTPFSIPELDALVSNSSPTILELLSPTPTHHPSGAGKTSLLYLIIAHAILPPTFDSIPNLNGQDAAIILFDPLRHFSVSRLAIVTLDLLATKLGAPIATLSSTVQASLLTLTHSSLSHVHIFHPTSWPSLLATLRATPAYLFASPSHKSTRRRLHSLILEDIDAF
ncbi:uncharacterized protein M421DRAFT_23567, partial [Didymella exigua CBS 183.55]